ncbi:GDP-mannose-dependent alpha-(1-6)-phosphatidylinositol monomannoside mannosyltransferase [Anaerolineales bacterium]|nr:GDP-mannose-dependent alpha-(1-6)-phosphatidylinositol monomannoside mannosyltransferase [Anaerolineales bacterium]
MKIGFLIYGSLDTLSGGYLYDRKLVEYLRAQGDTVEIISLPWRNYVVHLTDNFTFRLPSDLDILIQDELNHPSLIAANQRLHPYPIVSLVHHLRCSELRPKWQNDFYRVVERKYLQSVDGFIFNSKTTKGVVNGLLDGVILSEAKDLKENPKETLRSLRSLRVTHSEKPSVVAYPPTDRFDEAISEEEIRQRATSNELRILFLGNVIERKGLHTLLESIRLSTFNVRLDVIGSLTADSVYAKQMQDFVTVNGLSSIVEFHGALDNEQLLEKLRQAHVLIVPSSYEGFGIVYLEGMCFGLPAIGTTAGAAGEIIEHGKTGYLIQPNDSATLADRISELTSDRSLLTELSLNARRRYTQQPAWNETAGQIRTFLQSLTQQQ